MKSLIILVVFVAYLPAAAQDVEPVDSVDLAVQWLNEGSTSLDPKDILAWVDVPRSVKKGESLTLRITVENARKIGDFNLESVDMDGSFLRGFQIKSVTPSPVEIDGSLNTLTLEYPMTLTAGENVEFAIEMIAVEAGVYIGEASIWDEKDFLSRYVQCKVYE